MNYFLNSFEKPNELKTHWLIIIVRRQIKLYFFFTFFTSIIVLILMYNFLINRLPKIIWHNITKICPQINRPQMLSILLLSITFMLKEISKCFILFMHFFRNHNYSMWEMFCHSIFLNSIWQFFEEIFLNYKQFSSSCLELD